MSGSDGIWLDLSGTTHLFGGEERFAARLLGFLKRLGFSARVAIAGTPGSAYALARYGGRAATVLPEGREGETLAPLPLAALRLTPEALAAAARFGIERIADLYPMPRGPLARRLGRAAVERLDQARGFVFINYNPHFSNWKYALWVGVALLMIGLMGEFYTRRNASISWGARR